MKQFGIDISVYQGSFNFDRAISEGVSFVIIKGGGGNAGNYVDFRFAENYDKARAHGLPTGVYWYSAACSEKAAVKEVDYFEKNVLHGRQFSLPVYIDVEHTKMLSLGKSKLTAIVKKWCDTLEKRGYFVGIYASSSYFQNYMNDAELQRFAHWVAAWNKTYPSKYSPGLWQFGGETNLLRSNKVAGVVCDQDYLYVDYPKIIKENALNGFSPEDGHKKDIHTIALEVIRGEWGNGAERRRRLKAAGYDYNVVQAEVNRILYG